MTLHQHESANESYQDKLRRWYLAGLRKRAFLTAQEVTPAALVNMDQEFIDRLVHRSERESAAQSKDACTDSALRSVPHGKGGKTKAGFFCALLILFCVVLVSCNGEWSCAVERFYRASLACLFLSGAFGAEGHLGLIELCVFGVCFIFPSLVVLTGAAHYSQAGMQGLSKENRLLLLIPLAAILSGSAALIAAIACVSSLEHTSAESRIWLFCSSWMFIGSALSSLLLQRVVFKASAEIEHLLVTNKVPVGPDAVSVREELVDLLKQLDASFQREELIADASNDILCCFDAEFRIITMGGAACELLGFQSQELAGRSLLSLFLPLPLSNAAALMNEARQAKLPVAFEARLANKMGTVIDIVWTIEWSDTENCFFGQGKDISDQKALERARRDFIAMITHDIKNPVGAAVLNIETAESGIYGELSPECAQALGRTHSSLERILALTNELLEFEKLASGKQTLSFNAVESSELVNGCVQDCLSSARSKCISVQVEIGACGFEGDFDKLRRVVHNLLFNAIKYTPEGGTVHLSNSVTADSIEFRIRDSGPGIPAEYSSLIFERYERLPREEHSGADGSGLGLAIAKAIVEAHGGRIGVESLPEKGSTFWFRLPRSPLKSA